jgi:hypothetical protein
MKFIRADNCTFVNPDHIECMYVDQLNEELWIIKMVTTQEEKQWYTYDEFSSEKEAKKALLKLVMELA